MLRSTRLLPLATGRRVTAWGPYELTPCAYSMAMNRKAELESGAISYKAAVVLPGRGKRLANCVHAAGEIDPAEGRVAQFELQFGDNATRQLVRHYARRGYLINPHCPRDDVFLRSDLTDDASVGSTIGINTLSVACSAADQMPNASATRFIMAKNAVT